MGANHLSINQQHGDMGSVVLELYLKKAGLTKGRIIIMERGGGIQMALGIEK